MLGSLFLIALSTGGCYLLLIPAILINLATGEGDAALHMTLLALIGLAFAAMLTTSFAGRSYGLERKLNFLSLVLIWVCTPPAAAIGFLVLTDLGPAQAWFEAVSALTTTGATMLTGQAIPRGVLFWRAALEWYGGFLTLISIIHVLAPAGFGGIQASGRHRGTGGHSEGHWGSLGGYSSIFAQYAAITAVIGFGLIAANVEAPEAIMLAMVSVATGGFLPFDGPLEGHVGPMATLIMAIGFCFGTLNVFWRTNVFRGQIRFFRTNDEVKIVLAAIGILSVVYAARIADSAGFPPIGDLPMVVLEGFFTSASLISTSGIETRPGVVALLPDLLVLMIVMTGACVYSTAGGIKYYRVAAMAIYAHAELKGLIYPNAVTSLKLSGRPIGEDSIRAIWSYFVIALMCIAGGLVLISLAMPDFEAALALAAASFSSAGPVFDALRPGDAGLAATASIWPEYGGLPVGAMLPAIVLMTVGRLDVLIVFAVANISYWMKR